MYESYWKLAARPFENSSEPRFCFPAGSQHGALLKLRYVLENRRGAAILAGEAGLGKTFVVQSLLRELGIEFAPRVSLVFPQMPADQLLSCLADQLAGQQSSQTASLDQSVRRIERMLRENANAQRHAVIVLDEAHLLRDAQTLETVRLLMNFERDGEQLATFLFVGQTNLVLAVRKMTALDQRIAVTCLLGRLTAEETAKYIQHRLAAAGSKRAIFDSSALAAVHELTHGVPRRINRLCDLALLVGYGEELPSLSSQHIESIHQELIGSAVAA